MSFKPQADTAYVIKIDDRFFCGFTKYKRATKTAWSLAGSYAYLTES